MTPLERTLYKTHKSILEACREIGIEYILDSEIVLTQCADCGIWLFPKELIKDLDGQGICRDCVTHYGL
jgi:hypothetical protein